MRKFLIALVLSLVIGFSLSAETKAYNPTEPYNIVNVRLYSYTGAYSFNDLTYYNVQSVEYSENHVAFTYKGRKYVFSGSFMIYEEERR